MKSRSLFLAVGVALAAACAVLTAPAQAQPAPTPSSSRAGVSLPEVADRAPASYATAASRAVNRQRHRHDRRRLRLQSCLVDQAQARATAMARSGRLDHSSLGAIGATCGMRRVGENIAYGFPTGRSVVRRGWMHSAGHRRNLLSPHFRGMGLAAARGAGGVWYVALVFGHR